jgi:cellulose synthase/poly-beta-1,6-N-acetylglucosamine synthase-like glycosyltransferase
VYLGLQHERPCICFICFGPACILRKLCASSIAGGEIRFSSGLKILLARAKRSEDPLLIALIGLIWKKKVNKGPYEPFVSILIAAYNEQDSIEGTLKNKLDLDYPKDKLDIIVISDGSTDKTDEIVRKYESDQVRLIRQEPRAGKISALNMAVPQAKGEIIGFSDANSIWDKGALRHLVQNFNDPWGGGGYFRLIPFPLFKLGVKSILLKEKSYLFYLHPWELDYQQPRVEGVAAAYKFRHYFRFIRLKRTLSSGSPLF